MKPNYQTLCPLSSRLGGWGSWQVTPGRIRILERRGQWKLDTGKLESGSLSRPCSKSLGMLPITWSESLGLLLAGQMELVRSVLRFVTETWRWMLLLSPCQCLLDVDCFPCFSIEQTRAGQVSPFLPSPSLSPWLSPCLPPCLSPSLPF